MSMPRLSSPRVLASPWKNASASFTPKHINLHVNYRGLSTVLRPSPQQQQQQQPLQFTRRFSSPVESAAEGPQDAVAEKQEMVVETEGIPAANRTENIPPKVKKFLGYIEMEFVVKGRPAIAFYGEFWLRDNCQCPKCIHPDTRQRSVDTFKIPQDVSANKVRYESRAVVVDWSDGHTGVYPIFWLLAHQNKSPERPYPSKPGPSLRRFRKFHPTDPNSPYPTVTHEEVMTDNKAVFDWLEKIYDWGFCFVEGVPVEPEATQKLIERIAFVRHTHYGGFWDFTADLSFKDTAYTTEFLGAHTDNTYFTDPARLQLFHLLSHTGGQGGESLLVDGFRAAQLLKLENPQHAKALYKYRQPFHSSGNEDTCIQPAIQYPVFVTHPTFKRQLYQIRWNNYDRAAKVDWSSKEQEEWYTAARHFNEIIQRKDLEIWTQLQPGTALIFDNWRMLHGRSEFIGKRRMCGGYVNNDDFLSRYRLLKFGREAVLRNLGNTYNSESNPNMLF
ncbi:putative trimethyllysine dioxygenase TmlH [Aspergillus glaucus CBS 516.65]|uniref:Trimethyllysine dioxygenase n=1 Tax=Aspergillus glaucus CBS 516.65 TaxID=1160497 RepID=A0A1L9W0H7_ASPGL|nr:hypothetical protein ASPGLDRAFT_41668 [Aspergillus glaucus CBS 516.65]OJJ89649.1 hypothetical protein ASPGLDRAFT_41668 [Aspergillus glaucus CBS 516.65]